MTERLSLNQPYWTYDTPYDIIKRSEFAAKGDQRSIDMIDTYIDFINNKLGDDYRVVTPLGSYSTESPLRIDRSVYIYRLHAGGDFHREKFSPTNESFYGDSVAIINGTAVVIDSEKGIGGEAKEFIKIVNIEDSQSPTKEYFKYRRFRTNLLQRLSYNEHDNSSITLF